MVAPKSRKTTRIGTKIGRHSDSGVSRGTLFAGVFVILGSFFPLLLFGAFTRF